MRRILFLIFLVPVLLTSCQTTNFTDLIGYNQIGNVKVGNLEKKVKLRFDRTAALIDDQDHIIENKDIKKGTEVTVRGFVHRYIGSKKLAPHFFRENYTPLVDAWLVILPDGSRAFMEVPEMAIGVEGKNGEMVTDVKSQSNSVLFLYKTTSSDNWTDNPGIEYGAKQDVAVYLPVRHFKPFVGDKKYEDCHKIGLGYDGSKKGQWSSAKHSTRIEKEEVGRKTREYDRPNGLGYDHIKETTIITRTNKFIDSYRSRTIVENLHCLHCNMPIQVFDREEETTTRQVN